MTVFHQSAVLILFAVVGLVYPQNTGMITYDLIWQLTPSSINTTDNKMSEIDTMSLDSGEAWYIYNCVLHPKFLKSYSDARNIRCMWKIYAWFLV